MYGPEGYLYETNMTLLATLSDEELADPALIAQLTPSLPVMAELVQALATAIWNGLVAFGEACAPASEHEEHGAAPWLYLPFY